MNETTQGTARLSTSFLLNSIFEWTPQEAKIILFLISKIDPVSVAGTWGFVLGLLGDGGIGG